MKKIISNEKVIVEEILKNKELKKDMPTSTSIYLLIKYYCSISESKDEVYSKINEFLKDNYEEYNEVRYYDQINKNITSLFGKGKELTNVTSIDITKEELEVIKSEEKQSYQKILFSFLVYYKILNKINFTSNGWVNSDYIQEIFKTANARRTKFDTMIILSDMCDKGYMCVNNSEFNVANNNHKLLYIKEETPENPVEMIIDDFRELGLQWLEYNGDKKIKRCKVCGIRFKPKSNRQKMCKQCSDDKIREYDRNRKK